MTLLARFKAAIRAFQFPEVYYFHFKGMNEYLELKAEAAELWQALHGLLWDYDDAGGSKYFWGFTDENPENPWHESLMQARKALKWNSGKS